MRFLLLLGLCGLAFSFSCKDQNGKDVDWWAVYKMPIEQDNSVPGIAEGVAWYYVDVNKKGALRPSQETLNSKKQAIAYTLQQYYDVQNDPSIFHVMYNDEPYVAPTGAPAAPESWFDKISNYFDTSNAAAVQKGHTKGVSFFNKTNGVWYVHSVPLFPPPDKYEYPDSGHIYGQTMLCMSFKYSELAKIGTQLYYNNPQIYSSRLPSDMAQDNPDLAKVIGNQHKSGAPQSSIVDLTTVGGSSFKSFAKTNEFNNDLYDGLIAPILKTNLYAETWRRGSVIPVNCKQPYFTLDAQNMKIGSTAEFSYTKDHTKMARSVDTTKPYVCIGDINRMQSQYSRGGGSECISSTFLWNAFNVFVDTNSCPAPGKDFLRGNRVPLD